MLTSLDSLHYVTGEFYRFSHSSFFNEKTLFLFNNADAARVTCRLLRFAHVTTALFRFHWLPIIYRILYKIALLTFKVLKGMAPSYLSDLLVVQTKSHYSLRRNSQLLLKPLSTKSKTFGDRAFSEAAPKVWNILPEDIKNCEKLEQFKKSLKTFLFSLAYNCS